MSEDNNYYVVLYSWIPILQRPRLLIQQACVNDNKNTDVGNAWLTALCFGVTSLSTSALFRVKLAG